MSKEDSYKELPRIIQPKIELPHDDQKIPRLIFQTACTAKITDEVYDQVMKMMDENPTYAYFFYDDDDSREMIKTYFDEDVLMAYDELVPGAYKSDLFRYCCLYLNGGMYLDINKTLLVPVESLITKDCAFLSCIDRTDKLASSKILKLWQAIIATPPKNAILKACIDQIVKNVKTGYYGESQHGSLYITGPRVIGEKFEQYYGINPQEPIHEVVKGDEIILLKFNYFGTGAYDINNQMVINQNHTTRSNVVKIWHQVCKEQPPHYAELYYHGRIYKTKDPEFLSVCFLITFWKYVAIIIFCVIILSRYYSKKR